MSVTVASASCSATPASPPTLFLRHVKRPSVSTSPLLLCKPLPASASSLDLSRASPTQVLISLRFLVLSHLAELERRLSDFESPDLESWRTKGEIKIDEARQWARTAMEMLDGIRADVCSQLPDVQFSDPASVDSFLRAYLPELPDMSLLTDVRSHLRDISGVRSHLSDLNAHLPDFADMRSKLDDVKSRFNEIDPTTLKNFIPILITHMKKLHSHLSTLEVGNIGPSPFVPGSLLREILDALSSTDLVVQVAEDELKPVGETGGKTPHEVAGAVNNSLNGLRLITYDDLPHPWKNNPFVKRGYRCVSLSYCRTNCDRPVHRFIPIERWPLLIKSIFAFHNETRKLFLTHLAKYSSSCVQSIFIPT
jgi:adiponectin receptor